MPDPLVPDLFAMQDVTLRHPASGSPLFDHLHWIIQPRERWAVVGPEGCGKSQLLRLMAGLLRPDSGTIFLNGWPCHANPGRATLLGVLFAQPANRFLATTVSEEILLTPGSCGLVGEPLQQRLDEAMYLAGLPAAMVNRELAGLSGAQGARVALAAVLANHPRLLLADEPGRQLSTDGEMAMAQTLADQTHAPHAMASVIFTSRMERAKLFADRYLWLANGRLTALHG